MAAPSACAECGGNFTWEPLVGSGVCLNCGTLQDPSQTVLNSHIDVEDNGKHDPRHWVQQTTLKSVRTGWALAGQGKEASITRNKNEFHRYISALASRIGHSGLAPRAKLLFDQGMIRGQFRWGRKARLVAAAAIAIAAREAHKGTTIPDIAYLVNESSVSVSSMFIFVQQILGLKLESGDPSFHLPVLQTWIQELIAERPCPLPQSALKFLKPLDIPNASRTASSLSDLISRVGLLTDLPSPPTSCAIFMLALEAEAMSSAPNCAVLADALGRRFGVAGDTIFRRYRVISDQVEQWMDELPWLNSGFSSEIKGKVTKRSGISRSVRDVVQFREADWKVTLEKIGKPDIPRDCGDGQIEHSDDSVNGTKQTMEQSVEKRRKRRKIAPPLDAASTFLLSPLTPHTNSGRNGSADLDLISHLLTADQISLNHPPTRLGILAASKGEEQIADDELFAEGELESFLRNPEEIAVLEKACDWAKEEEIDEEGHVARAQIRDRERGGTTRVNMEALNRLLAETESEWEEAEYKEDDEWMTETMEDSNVAGVARLKQLRSSAIPISTGQGHEEVEPWRPLSPSAHMSWGDDTSRFDFDE
ncbi:hypothetical protein BD410DRAFT_894660 [Rickenella mellea]|uniref:TFIIB-type domain-containing protein n=1 Tax=Rickenella mellea TaxID=50990 RepID=A0A4Y7QJQ4_9AGAM|nr:hypothetical protein BD410DRAFT_894660 [Rickenella mellea]